MATSDDNLPPALGVLAAMLQAAPLNPAVSGLLAELALIRNRLPRGDWAAAFQDAAPLPQILAMGLAGSFAASGALSVSVTGSAGSPLEACPVPGCGRRRTTK
jgi:hypothetical protein